MTGRYKAYPEYKNAESLWFDAIPLNWQTILLKRVVLAIKDGTHGTYPRVSEGMPLLSAKNVFNNGIYLSKSESQISLEHHEEIVRNGFPAKGDLLITCVGTIGRAFVYDRKKSLSFQRSVAFVRFKGNAFPQYYKYYVESKPYQSQLKSLVKASAQGGIYMGDLVATESLLPPYIEQQKIASFLDHETAKIDTLIAKQEKLIELLKEKRQAVISHAVTKGLNPDAPMKDSGVEWLGEIPEHWVVGRYKVCTKRIVVGIAEAATHAYADVGVPLIRSTNIKDDGALAGELLYLKEKFADSNYSKYLYHNDIVTVRTGYPGVSAVIPKQLDKSQCFTNLVATPKKKHKSEFLANVLNSHFGKAYFKFQGWGSAQQNISVPILENTPVAFPTLSEQEYICSYVNQQRSYFKKLISLAECSIKLMKERRTALISAAVTGKIDVRDWQLAVEQEALYES